MQLIEQSASINVSPSEYLRLSDFQRFDELSGHSTYCATVNASAGSFACIHYPFFFADLPGFTRKLASAFHALKGTVALQTERETDTLTFHFNETSGRVALSGDLGRSSGAGSLQFSFGFDQTYLGPFLVELEAINRALHG